MTESDRIKEQIDFIQAVNKQAEEMWKDKPMLFLTIDPESMNVVSSERVTSAHESALLSNTCPKMLITLLMKHNGLPLDMAIGAMHSAVESAGNDLMDDIRQQQVLAMASGAQA